MKMHWRLFFALCLVALTSAAPSMNLEASGDESGNDVLKFHSSLEVDREWLSFKETYDKSYDDDEEELHRKKIFAANLKKIEEHNQLHAKGLKTYTLGVNQFADMESHERKRCINIKKLPDIFRDHVVEIPKKLSNVSDSVDWRTIGAVTPAKNQLSCGSCWAFSAAAALESHNFLKWGKLVSLSEQNLVDCAGEKYGNKGCDGGLPFYAFEYVCGNNGIEIEDTYGYENAQGTCRYSSMFVGGNCTGWSGVEPGSEEDLKRAVANYGPIVVAIHSIDTYELYKGGVYMDAHCKSDFESTNHGVVVVGYGTTDTNPKIDYWIVKNSWGEGWGMNGFGLMARNRGNHCGIASLATFPIV